MRIIKYSFIGGVAAVIDISLFAFFAGYIGWPWLPVSFCTFVFATLINYLLSIKYVFESGIRYQKNLEITAVYIVSIFGLSINQLVLFLLIVSMGWSLIYAKLCATGLVFFWNYFSRKKFIF
jgi:putative flippase GtrA